MNMESLLMLDPDPKQPMIRVDHDTHRRVRLARRILALRQGQDLSLRDVVMQGIEALAKDHPELAEIPGLSEPIHA